MIYDGLFLILFPSIFKLAQAIFNLIVWSLEHQGLDMIIWRIFWTIFFCDFLEVIFGVIILGDYFDDFVENCLKNLNFISITYLVKKAVANQ